MAAAAVRQRVRDHEKTLEREIWNNWQRRVLSSQDVANMQDELICVYRREDFQNWLRQAWDQAEEDPYQQKKARTETCFPIQCKIVSKYGFPPTRRGIAQSDQAVMPYAAEPAIAKRIRTLEYLTDPGAQANAQERLKAIPPLFSSPEGADHAWREGALPAPVPTAAERAEACRLREAVRAQHAKAAGELCDDGAGDDGAPLVPPLRFAAERPWDSAEPRPEDADRPPVGSGYALPSYSGPRPALDSVLVDATRGAFQEKSMMADGPRLLTDRAGEARSEGNGATPGGATRLSALRAQQQGTGAPEVGSRRERIEALEHGLHAHEASKLAQLAQGTERLRDPNGELLAPPVPPLEDHDRKLQMKHRLKLLRMNRRAKEDVHDNLLAAKLIGEDGRNRPYEGLPTSRRAPPESDKGSRLPAPNVQEVRTELAALSLCDTQALLTQAERAVEHGASEDQWLRIATQLCSRAYDLSCDEVLRVVRTLGNAALGSGADSARGKKELLRAADHLLASLTCRLQDTSVDALTDVLETMSDAGIGNQTFLDLILAQTLARHHRDCQALTPSRALRLASALGRLASTLRLRPKGNGGPGTSTSRKMMEILQKRIVERLSECEVEGLARLDEYYLTRLCEDDAARLIIERMAQLEIGFRGASKQYLPLMIRLEAAIQRELSNPFRWNLPRLARDYLARLKDQGLRKTAPGTVSDPFAEARAKIRGLNAPVDQNW
eukprot:gnl/TRDRNA2_/TRDRNA2_157692_c0_seq1.p1 gnl/TRDRNA2_/TRDRNA2_157692_c0~~gnl/TRDRNA2_/TRDRNA2_157692_c0_seq1.p1  ORF type:complete len:744 (-),score=123.91 gnl/TRDRNA2_/TRDRNA2_157692_c0_seq1:76-2250(-)